MATPSNETKIVATEKARQGRWGWQILMVLVGGLMLAAIAWYGAEFFGEAIETPATQNTAPAQ